MTVEEFNETLGMMTKRTLCTVIETPQDLGRQCGNTTVDHCDVCLHECCINHLILNGGSVLCSNCWISDGIKKAQTI